MPINVVVCLVSILNFASLKAENNAKEKVTYETTSKDPPLIILKRIKEGRTPNVTISARESNSLPIGELTFSNLALKPSKKSKTAAIHMA